MINISESDKLINLYEIKLISILILILVFFIVINNNPIKNNEISSEKERLFLYKKDNNSSITIGKKKIDIAMAIDNNGIFVTLISIVSALENNNKKKNVLIYHLLLSHDFNMEKIKYFESLKEKYDFLINYYRIPNIFNETKKWRNSSVIYYKLLIPLIFFDYERIIFLDYDTLVFQDIYEMFNQPFNDNYALGYPFNSPLMKSMKNDGEIKSISVGVMLMNINKIRKDDKDLELIKYTLQNSNKIIYPEQDALNYIFRNKIGLLPLKYGIVLYGNIHLFKEKYSHQLRLKLDLQELEKAMNEPSIVHLSFCNPKIWVKKSKHEYQYNQICEKYNKYFYFYANKTKYYDEIYNKYMK